MKHLYIFLFLIAFQLTNAQVLWSDDFDSYPVGLLSTDPTGVSSGLGGWYVRSPYNEVKIVSETGRGKVMALGWIQFIGASHGGSIKKMDLDVLWKNRNKINNIFKFEFEMQALNDFKATDLGHFTHSISINNTNAIGYIGQLHCRVTKDNSFVSSGPVNYKYSYSWIKVEMYLDYNTNTFYCYVPNHFIAKEIRSTIDQPYQILLNSSYMMDVPLGLVSVKYDNMKISAIPTLPTYLDINEFLASKFNVFPNPAKNIITITNNENIGIELVEIYDVSGKKCKVTKL